MPADDPALVDSLEEQPRTASGDAAPFSGVGQGMERDAVSQVLELKAAEQQQGKQRKGTKAQDEKKKRAAALLALKNDIRDALERFPQRTNHDLDRYEPYPDGYNYGYQTRWSEDKETKCTQCIKSNVTCWRSVVYSAELYRCLRCKDKHRGCDRGLNATGVVTRLRKARMGARNQGELSSPTGTSVSSAKLARTGTSPSTSRSVPSSQQLEDVTMPVDAGHNPTNPTSETLAALVASIDQIREVTEANTSALINLADENRRGLAKIADLEKMILLLTSQGAVVVKEEPLEEDNDSEFAE